jgi:Ca-activated chloride channel homolog
MSFYNAHFAEPKWLWLAIAGPMLVAALQFYSSWARARQLALIASPHFLDSLTRSHSPVRRMLRNLFLIMAVSGIGFALARPQWGEHEDKVQSLGQDIVFVMDCSRSMLATDVMPNRLQRARLALLDWVQRHGRGRVGLVAFAGQAFLQCPLTLDYAAFEDAMNAISDKTIPIPGTDIGRALDEALRAMDKNERRKFIVLVTDGEDLEKGGVRTAEALAKQGAVVFTIGVGTQAGSEIQVLTDMGRVETIHDSKGQVVVSRLDEKTLREIAQATGGSYYPLGPLGEGLSRARLDVETISSKSGPAPVRKRGIDRYHIPIAAVLVLLITEPLIGSRRRMETISSRTQSAV